MIYKIKVLNLIYYFIFQEMSISQNLPINDKPKKNNNYRFP